MKFFLKFPGASQLTFGKQAYKLGKITKQLLITPRLISSQGLMWWSKVLFHFIHFIVSKIFLNVCLTGSVSLLPEERCQGQSHSEAEADNDADSATEAENDADSATEAENDADSGAETENNADRDTEVGAVIGS